MSAYRFSTLQVDANPTADLFAVDEQALLAINFHSPHTWTLETPVAFRVQRPLDGVTDMPVVSLPLTVFSRRVADTLMALGTVATRYDIQLEDMDGNPVGSAGDFVIFHVQTFLDAVDTEAEGVEIIDEPGLPIHGMPWVYSLSLIDPGGFPACFRVTHAASFGPILNDAARAAVEALGPRGFELVSVPTRSLP